MPLKHKELSWPIENIYMFIIIIATIMTVTVVCSYLV